MFVDSRAFIARFISSDAHHETARRAWLILDSGRPLLTTNLVVAEVVNYVAHQTNGSFASQAGQRIIASAMLQIERTEQDHELASLALMRNYADQRFSFTDCVSFVVMKRRKLKRAFCFDSDFTIAGFEVWSG
jgi:hypothetical protein